VLVSHQNNLVWSKNDDVTSGSMSTTPVSGKVDFCRERDKEVFFLDRVETSLGVMGLEASPYMEKNF